MAENLKVKNYADGGLNIQRDVAGNCPAKCIDWDGENLTIDNKACRKCRAKRKKFSNGLI